MLELFHAIGDAESARVRKYIVDHELLPHFRFRNTTYEEVKRDLHARGGDKAPALWDGTVLIQGADAVLERIAALG